MPKAYYPVITLLRPVLIGLVILNLLFALGIVALFVFSFSRADWFEFIGFFKQSPHDAFLTGLRAMMLLGVVGCGVMHLLLRRLQAIVASVHTGDPFVPENARHLTHIGWYLVAGQGVHLLLVAIAEVVNRPTYRVEFGPAFSLTAWLAILLVFALAGIFAHGTRLREELEGTV